MKTKYYVLALIVNKLCLNAFVEGDVFEIIELMEESW
jgi:hypothetical protein